MRECDYCENEATLQAISEVRQLIHWEPNYIFSCEKCQTSAAWDLWEGCVENEGESQ